LQNFKCSIVFRILGVKWTRVIMFPLPHLFHGWSIPITIFIFSHHLLCLSTFFYNKNLSYSGPKWTITLP
jgi:hypothetical protein